MKLSLERRRQRADLVKLTLFLAVAGLVTAWVAALTGEYRPADRSSYAAVFENVSGLSVGDDVRIAGVDVGKVRDIEVRADNTVRVAFDVRRDQQLTTRTEATIEYRNLIGDRVVQLGRGRGTGQVLEPGGTIPSSRTASALDLDTLLNGFRPLFAGLSPTQINELSGEVVQVLQGRQSAVASLVHHVGSFATRIGSREELIGQVIRNLNVVLGDVDKGSGSLRALVDRLDGLLVGLDEQDTQVLDAAGQVDRFARETSGLLAAARPDLTGDLAALAVAARGVNRNSATLRKVLATLPVHYRALAATASYGNFYNTFICGLRVQTDLGTSPWLRSDAPRCSR